MTHSSRTMPRRWRSPSPRQQWHEHRLSAVARGGDGARRRPVALRHRHQPGAGPGGSAGDCDRAPHSIEALGYHRDATATRSLSRKAWAKGAVLDSRHRGQLFIRPEFRRQFGRRPDLPFLTRLGCLWGTHRWECVLPLLAQGESLRLETLLSGFLPHGRGGEKWPHVAPGRGYIGFWAN